DNKLTFILTGADRAGGQMKAFVPVEGQTQALYVKFGWNGRTWGLGENNLSPEARSALGDVLARGDYRAINIYEFSVFRDSSGKALFKITGKNSLGHQLFGGAFLDDKDAYVPWFVEISLQGGTWQVGKTSLSQAGASVLRENLAGGRFAQVVDFTVWGTVNGKELFGLTGLDVNGNQTFGSGFTDLMGRYQAGLGVNASTVVEALGEDGSFVYRVIGGDEKARAKLESDLNRIAGGDRLSGLSVSFQMDPRGNVVYTFTLSKDGVGMQGGSLTNGLTGEYGSYLATVGIDGNWKIYENGVENRALEGKLNDALGGGDKKGNLSLSSDALGRLGLVFNKEGENERTFVQIEWDAAKGDYTTLSAKTSRERSSWAVVLSKDGVADREKSAALARELDARKIEGRPEVYLATDELGGLTFSFTGKDASGNVVFGMSVDDGKGGYVVRSETLQRNADGTLSVVADADTGDDAMEARLNEELSARGVTSLSALSFFLDEFGNVGFYFAGTDKDGGLAFGRSYLDETGAIASHSETLRRENGLWVVVDAGAAGDSADDDMEAALVKELNLRGVAVVSSLSFYEDGSGNLQFNVRGVAMNGDIVFGSSFLKGENLSSHSEAVRYVKDERTGQYSWTVAQDRDNTEGDNLLEDALQETLNGGGFSTLFGLSFSIGEGGRLGFKAQGMTATGGFVFGESVVVGGEYTAQYAEVFRNGGEGAWQVGRHSGSVDAGALEGRLNSRAYRLVTVSDLSFFTDGNGDLDFALSGLGEIPVKNYASAGGAALVWNKDGGKTLVRITAFKDLYSYSGEDRQGNTVFTYLDSSTGREMSFVIDSQGTLFFSASFDADAKNLLQGHMDNLKGKADWLSAGKNTAWRFSAGEGGTVRIEALELSSKNVPTGNSVALAFRTSAFGIYKSQEGKPGVEEQWKTYRENRKGPGLSVSETTIEITEETVIGNNGRDFVYVATLNEGTGKMNEVYKGENALKTYALEDLNAFVDQQVGTDARVSFRNGILFASGEQKNLQISLALEGNSMASDGISLSFGIGQISGKNGEFQGLITVERKDAETRYVYDVKDLTSSVIRETESEGGVEPQKADLARMMETPGAEVSLTGTNEFSVVLRGEEGEVVEKMDVSWGVNKDSKLFDGNLAYFADMGNGEGLQIQAYVQDGASKPELVPDFQVGFQKAQDVSQVWMTSTGGFVFATKETDSSGRRVQAILYAGGITGGDININGREYENKVDEIRPSVTGMMGDTTVALGQFGQPAYNLQDRMTNDGVEMVEFVSGDERSAGGSPFALLKVTDIAKGESRGNRIAFDALQQYMKGGFGTSLYDVAVKDGGYQVNFRSRFGQMSLSLAPSFRNFNAQVGYTTQVSIVVDKYRGSEADLFFRGLKDLPTLVQKMFSGPEYAHLSWEAKALRWIGVGAVVIGVIALAVLSLGMAIPALGSVLAGLAILAGAQAGVAVSGVGSFISAMALIGFGISLAVQAPLIDTMVKTQGQSIAEMDGLSQAIAIAATLVVAVSVVLLAATMLHVLALGAAVKSIINITLVVGITLFQNANGIGQGVQESGIIGFLGGLWKGMALAGQSLFAVGALTTLGAIAVVAFQLAAGPWVLALGVIGMILMAGA
ncbi:MAG: hypothetical protein HY548_09005, partial [Elusimicrobia bacterium]|nr:hypothetical protein [Elusimicrobiota bacterium]